MTNEQFYRELAFMWHGGQASALYAFASTGTILPGLKQELRHCIELSKADHLSDTEHLERFLRHIEKEAE